jgi:hypothetical protein
MCRVRRALCAWDGPALGTRGVRPNSNEFTPGVICLHEYDYRNSSRVWPAGGTAANPRAVCVGHGIPSAERGRRGFGPQIRQLYHAGQPVVSRGGPVHCPDPRGAAKARHAMKITGMPSPALCRLPLIEASCPTISHCTIKTSWHPEGFLVRLVSKLCECALSRVPLGYEDATGFHHGAGPDSGPWTEFNRIH